MSDDLGNMTGGNGRTLTWTAARTPFCRCGHTGDASRACPRLPRCVGNYQAKLSGPLLDRIDIHIEVPPVSPADLSFPPSTER